MEKNFSSKEKFEKRTKTGKESKFKKNFESRKSEKYKDWKNFKY